MKRPDPSLVSGTFKTVIAPATLCRDARRWLVGPTLPRSSLSLDSQYVDVVNVTADPVLPDLSVNRKQRNCHFLLPHPEVGD